MTVTKAILTEQILRILSGGNPSDRDRWRSADIQTAISDVANQLLKVEDIGTMAIQGMPNVDGLAVATYENIEISRDVNWNTTRTAKITLPATPMMLENGMGVQMIYPSGRPDLAFKFIPFNIFGSWTKSRMVAPLHRRLYTYHSGKIVVYDDLFGSGYTTVDVLLTISDISQSGENDPLPILPEHRDAIVGAVVRRFMETPDTNRRETDQPSPSKRN